MPYIEWHHSIRHHHKTDHLAELLNIEPYAALGIRGALYAWAVDERPGGIVERSLLAVAARFPRDKREALEKALMDAKLIDPADDPKFVQIHDWQDFTRGYRKSKADVERRRSATVAQQTRDSSAIVAVNRSEQRGTERKGEGGPPPGSLDYLLRLAHTKHLAAKPETITQYVTAWYHRVGAEQTEKMLFDADGLSVNDIQDKYFPRNGKPPASTVEAALDDWVKKKTEGAKK